MEVQLRSDPRHAYGAMDAMRAIAALVVAVSHIRDLIMIDYDGGVGIGLRTFYFITGFGHAGVIVFFVLSGFWITKSVVRRSSIEGPFWASYLIDRVSRLWIVLVPVLVLGGLLDWFGVYILRSPIYAGTSGALSLALPIQLDAVTFFANIAFLQTIAASVFGSNGPLWSLAYEFWYYIWLPALLFAIRGRPSWLLLALLVAVLDWSVLFGFLSWLSGTLLYIGVERAKRRPPSRKMGFAILAIGLVTSVAMLTALRVLHAWWMDPFLALAFATMLFGLCVVDPRMPGVKSIAAYGARSSFSLYAIHFPIAALVAALLPHGRLQAGWHAILLTLVVAVTVSVVGHVFSLATEAHTARLRSILTRWFASSQERKIEPSFSERDMTDRVDEIR